MSVVYQYNTVFDLTIFTSTAQWLTDLKAVCLIYSLLLFTIKNNMIWYDIIYLFTGNMLYP